jgi:hypothetical protein
MVSRATVAQRVAELERLAQDARGRVHAERLSHDIQDASATPATRVEVILADQTRVRARVMARELAIVYISA